MRLGHVRGAARHLEDDRIGTRAVRPRRARLARAGRTARPDRRTGRPAGGTTHGPGLRACSCGSDLRPSITRADSDHRPGLRICAWLSCAPASANRPWPSPPYRTRISRWRPSRPGSTCAVPRSFRPAPSTTKATTSSPAGTTTTSTRSSTRSKASPKSRPEAVVTCCRPRRRSGSRPGSRTTRRCDTCDRSRCSSTRRTITDFGDRARVLAASSLMREMMTYAIRWPIGRRESDRRSRRVLRRAAGRHRRGARARSAALAADEYRRARAGCDGRDARAHLAADLGDVCAAIGCSPRTLRRRFHDATGWTWQEYRRAARVIAAMLELATRETTIARAAADAGFESVTSFTRAFTRATGETPSAYRARARGYLRGSTRSKPV